MTTKESNSKCEIDFIYSDAMSAFKTLGEGLLRENMPQNEHWSTDPQPTATQPLSLFSLSPASAVTLKHLCERDKQRVRHLILELATAGQEKDTVERTLGKERGRFREALIQLNQQMISLEKENNHILLLYMYM